MTPLLTSLMLLTLVQTPAPATQKAASPATKTFHSSAAHFDYTYPANLVVDEKVMADAMQGEKDKAEGAVAKAAISCVSTPFTGIDEANGFQMAVILRLDGACLGVDLTAAALPQLINPMMTESLTRIGTPTIGKPTTYKVSGYDAIVLPGTAVVKDSDTIVYGAVTCLSTGKDAVCWEFLSDKCTTLSALAASPVKFEGKEPEPLIPTKMLPCN